MSCLSAFLYFLYSLFIFIQSYPYSVMTGSAPGAASSVFRGNKPNHQGSSQKQDSNNQPGGLVLDNYDRNMERLNINYYDSSIPIPDEQMLIMKLLRNYDPAARPVYNASTPVVIKFGFALIQICDMDERNQIFTTNVWLEQEWIDERLQWNESDYNGLDKIRIPCNRIWLPDIVLYNSADDYTEGYMQSKAMVKSNGEVFWPPPAKLRSSCVIDVTFFPFDDQICHLKFGSWTYSGLQVDLTNKSNTIDLSNYIKSGEWDLKNVIVERNVVYYPCCPDEPYPDVIFYIYIRRRILYYLFNIILPCVWLSILSLVGFWLPPDSGEKITLGITVLLAFSVFMLLIAENIPATSEMVPLIGIYLTTTMSLTSTSIVLTVLVLHLHHAGQFAPILPRKFFRIMTKTVAYYVGMSSTVGRYQVLLQKCEKFCKNPSKNDKIKLTLLNCNDELEELKNDLKTTQAEVKKNKYHTPFHCLSSCVFCKNSESKTNRKLQTISNNLASQINNTNENIQKHLVSSDNENENTNRINGVNESIESFSSIKTPIRKKKHNSNNNNSILCNECAKSQNMYSPNKEYIETLDIFSKHLKEFLKKEDLNRVSSNLQNEWKLVALIVDRVLFWLFSVLTIVSSVILLLILPILKNRELIKPYSNIKE